MESPDAYGRKRKKAAKAPATTAALASSFPQRETPKQQAERLERERKERAQQHLQRATPRIRTKTAPPADPMAAQTAARLAKARGLLEVAGRQHVSPATMTRRQEVLRRDLANTLALPPSAVQELMTSTGLKLSDSALTGPKIEQFLTAVQAHPVYAQRAATKTAPVTATLPVTAPATRGTTALAACRRLVAGNAAGEPAKLTAALYLAIVELAAYGAAPEHRAAAHIVAERFGVHTDAATAAQLHTRTQRAYDRGTAPEALDHLSRLARRPRGVFFYDGHLDRLTLWETEGPTMTLSTCSVPELRAGTAGALERGDLILPRLAKKTLDARTEPTRAQDPALILAVAAEQPGKQSELARRRA